MTGLFREELLVIDVLDVRFGLRIQPVNQVGPNSAMKGPSCES